MTHDKAIDYDIALKRESKKRLSPYHKQARALLILIDEYDLYYDGVDTKYYCKNIEVSKYLSDLLERRVCLIRDEKRGIKIASSGITLEIEKALIQKAQQVLQKRQERYENRVIADLDKINTLL